MSVGKSNSIAATLLAEFDQEAKTTRKFLEQLPEEQLEWRPHPKSMSAGQLALHIASAPGGVIKMTTLESMPIPDFGRPNPQPASLKEVFEAFEGSVSAVHETLVTFSDDQMHAIWRMTRDEKEIFAIPRGAVCRSFLLNHWYHHRGQLGVYLRLLGAKVPSSYGPSGDELPDFAT